VLNLRGNRAIAAGLVVLVGAAVVAIVGVGDHHASVARRLKRSFDFGPFAGYAELGPTVRSVSAVITVPRAGSGRKLAMASTWIGAETLGPQVKEPFIQVGVKEVSQFGITAYLPFWSDTVADYQTIPFPDSLAVHAGDRISVSLTLSHRDWIITIASGRVHLRRVTAEEGAGTFQEALWFQEDEAQEPLGGNHRLTYFPFPRLAGARVSDLSVDGHAPERRDLNASWMSVGGSVLEPTRLNQDAFGLAVHEAATPAANIRPVVATLVATGDGSPSNSNPMAKLLRATMATPPESVVRWASQMSSALVRFAGPLRRARWPRTARDRVAALLSSLQEALALTQGLQHDPTSELAGWKTRWSAWYRRILIAEARLLASLHTPW